MSESRRMARAFPGQAAAWHLVLLLLAQSVRAVTIFGDGFEVGSVCHWSSTVPAVACAAYQTCDEAAGNFWGCFELPFAAPPAPGSVDGSWLPPAEDVADLYVLFDRSGDMAAETISLKNNLASVLFNVTCPPMGGGPPGACYPDLWTGAGVINYASTTPSFQNILDVQPNPTFASVPTSDPPGCCYETGLLSTWATITGSGSAASACTAVAFPARSTCAGSPAANAGYATFGYPCFRSPALTMVLLPASDDLSNTLVCPGPTVVAAVAQTAGVRIVGLLGSGYAPNAAAQLQQLASATGAVDPANGNAPLVFEGFDSSASTAVQNLLLTARSMFRYTAVEPAVLDDPSDAVDVTAAFVERIEAVDFGAPECTTGLGRADRDLDGFDETYLDVPFGSTLCFRIVARTNANVPEGSAAQNYLGSLTLTVNDDPPAAASLPLLFLVPPG